MALTITHAKTNTIANWTQADLDAQIALGNFPPGTLLANIVLPSDWNESHSFTGTLPAANVEAAGSDTQVQYNNAGALAGSADYTWNNTTKILTVGIGNSGYTRFTSGVGSNNGFVVSAFSNFIFSSNAYFDGTNFRYEKAGFASAVQTESTTGNVYLNTYSSGSAGAIVSGGPKVTVLNNGDVGIGAASPSARIHAIKTTEQMRLGYDVSNYYSTTVGSTGSVAFTAVGSAPAFTFNNPISIVETGTNVATTWTGLSVTNAGSTFNTTAGAINNYMAIFTNTATRATGANALTNYGIFASASGAQNNYAAVFNGGNVGINNTTPAKELTIGALTALTQANIGTTGIAVSQTGSVVGMTVENTGASGVSAGGLMSVVSQDGAAMASGDRLGGYLFGGNNGTIVANGAAILAYASEAWSGSAVGTDLSFDLVAPGVTSRTQKFKMFGNGRFLVGTGTSATSQLEVNRDANDSTTSGVLVLNPNTGTAAAPFVKIGETLTGNKNIGIYYLNSGFTASGTTLPNSALITAQSGATAGLVIRTDADAPIIFGRGGAVSESGRFGITSGYLGLGTAANIYTRLNVSDGGTISSAITASLGAAAAQCIMTHSNTAGNNIIGMNATNAATSRSSIQCWRARGTLASPTTVATDDIIGDMLFAGYDGGRMNFAAGLFCYADATPTINSVTPMRLSFVTGGSSADRQERLIIKSTGEVLVGAGLGLKATVSSAATLTLDTTATTYVFSGTTTTWSLPAVATNTNRIYYIKNRGTGAITLSAATNTIYDTAITTTSTIAAGAAAIVQSDGTYWVVM